MTDSASAQDLPPDTPAGATAGSLLRQARQARGLHIAALATSIKVTPRKLELLESDRFDELPGATFTRALAQTVCRTLKIDSAPVLALLPSAVGQGLEHMSRGLNEPFRDRPGRSVPKDLAFLKNPVLLGAVVLIGLATAVYMLPPGWLSQHLPKRSTAPEASAQAVPGGVVSETVVNPSAVPAPAGDVMPPDAASGVYSAPAEPPLDVQAPASVAALPAAVPAANAMVVAPATAADAASSGATATAGALQLRASAQSWVEVIDRRGVAVLSRMLQAGETVAVDGASPLRVRIGNAQATQVTFKGERIDLSPVTSRENVARLELK